MTTTNVIIFETDLANIINQLRTGVIRMARDPANPHMPLRPDKEIVLDPTGLWVEETPEIGISLAGTLDKLMDIWRPGRENSLFIIDRNLKLDDPFYFNTKNKNHWIIVINKRMLKVGYIKRLETMMAHWRLIGRYIRRG